MEGTCFICCGEGGTAFCGDGCAFHHVLKVVKDFTELEVEQPIWLCVECRTVVEAIEVLHRLVEETQRKVAEKVRWLEERTRKRIRIRSSSEEVSDFKHGRNSGISHAPVDPDPGGVDCLEMDFEFGLKTEPVDVDDTSFLSDFEEPSDGEENSLNFSSPGSLLQHDKRRKNSTVETKVHSGNLSENDLRLVELWGLDKTPQLSVSISKLKDVQYNSRIFQDAQTPQLSYGEPGADEDDFAEVDVERVLRGGHKRKYSTARSFYRHENAQVKNSDPDFDPVSESLDSEKQDRNMNDVYQIKRSRKKRNEKISRPEPFFPKIKGGKMWFGVREVSVKDNFFHCCYESCQYTLAKSLDEEKSCSLVMEHMKSRHTGYGIFSCRRCVLRFQTRQEYFMHYAKEHRSSKESAWVRKSGTSRKVSKRSCDFTPHKSNKGIESCKSIMHGHITAEHAGSGATGAYSCGNCDLRFETELDYQKHYADAHRFKKVGAYEKSSDKRFQRTHNKIDCDVCGRPLLAITMKKHKWSHMNDEEKALWLSEGRRNPVENYRLRKERIKSKISHLCSTCGKGFSNKAGLRLHEEKHKDFSERRKFICDECGAVMITFNGLRIHKRLKHDRESLLGKWKICQICPDSKFLTRTLLDIHMMRFHGAEKKCKCDKCDKTFSEISDLKRHLKTHMKLGAIFQCNYCPRSYHYDKSLQRHIKSTHPEQHEPRGPIIKPKEKPIELTCKQMYPCSVCEKLYELPSRLRKHLKYHEVRKD